MTKKYPVSRRIRYYQLIQMLFRPFEYFLRHGFAVVFYNDEQDITVSFPSWRLAYAKIPLHALTRVIPKDIRDSVKELFEDKNVEAVIYSANGYSSRYNVEKLNLKEFSKKPRIYYKDRTEQPKAIGGGHPYGFKDFFKDIRRTIQVELVRQ